MNEFAVGDLVVYHDRARGREIDAVVTKLGEDQRGAGQAYYIETVEGVTVYTNYRTLTRRDE